MYRAWIAFRHPVVFRPGHGSHCYANADNLKLDFDPNLVGVLPSNPPEAMSHTRCLNKPDEYLPDPYPVVQVQRPGESLPSQLMCWMVSGSRPSLLPSDSQVSDAEVAAELEKHDILVDGSPSDRITRAEKHGLTIRKPARLINTEEARAVLYSREAAITGSTIAELCDQIICCRGFSKLWIPKAQGSNWDVVISALA